MGGPDAALSVWVAEQQEVTLEKLTLQSLLFLRHPDIQSDVWPTPLLRESGRAEDRAGTVGSADQSGAGLNPSHFPIKISRFSLRERASFHGAKATVPTVAGDCVHHLTSTGTVKTAWPAPSRRNTIPQLPPCISEGFVVTRKTRVSIASWVVAEV